MKKIIRKLFAPIHQRLFEIGMEWKIYHRIFPHMNQETNYGFPFSSKVELVNMHIRGRLQASRDLELIGQAAARMPKAYGDAFRYIVFRDLNTRMEMYLELAEKRLQPEDCDPRHIATRA